MTPKRQNEIWAILPEDFKEQLCYDYEQARVALLQDPTNVRIGAHKTFLVKYFGLRNLTAQAEEKPKEEQNHKSISSNDQNCEKFTENGILHQNTVTKVDYQQYRLDLAKEIAVAMIGANWEPADIPRDAVEDANEIVKRLKETEE